jgi:transcriptional regulator with XRE-family HTH domain
MHNLLSIRKRLGVSQADLGEALGLSQGNVSHYECDRQPIPPDVARRIIKLAAERGHTVSFDDIYAEPVTETFASETSCENADSSHQSAR